MTVGERAIMRAHMDYTVALAESGRNPAAQARFDVEFIDIIGKSLCDVGVLAALILSVTE